MESSPEIVISASRRTDIPAFYMEWFMAQIAKGAFHVVNPFNGRTTVVPAIPRKVHTIVFWSKNFRPFLDGDFDKKLTAMGFHLFFNFTVNSPDTLLEPHLPPLDARLEQLRALARRNGAGTIHWRFDPICHYRTSDGRIRDNLEGFSTIAAAAEATGIRRCITSFMDDYPKIRKRTAATGGCRFIDPPADRKVEILRHMEDLLKTFGIRLFTCCEKAIQALLPAGSSIAPASCVPNDLLRELYGGAVSLKKDTGQRVAAGCGCKVSVDIGSYRRHPCYHNCLFCYANPSPPPERRS